MFRHDENAAPTHAQFAMRVAILGGIALVAFGAIFFRLWFLEVLSGEAYLKEANANRVREIKIQAPRGEILDRAGRVLVDNKTVLSLQVQPSELPQQTEPRNKELRKVAEAAGMSYGKVKDEMTTQMAAAMGMKPSEYKQAIREGSIEPPAVPVTLKQDVDKDVVYFLRERQDEFPGVTASQVYVRDYPNGTLGAHLFGYVSEIGPDQLKEPAYEGLEAGDRIGATGLELQYDQILRGRNGAVRVQVDASGKPRGRELSRIEPEAGDNLKLTLDKKVQAAGESALAGTAAAGCVRRDERRRRLDPRHGVVADLRPERLHAAGLDEDGQGAHHRRGGPTARPRDPVRLPDRIDVQGDQRVGGAPIGADHARPHVRGHRVVLPLRPQVDQRRRGGQRRRRHGQRPPRLLRRLLLRHRRPRQSGLRQGWDRDHPGLGQAARLRIADRRRPAG